MPPNHNIKLTWSFLDNPTLSQIQQITSLYRSAGWWTESTRESCASDDIRVVTGIVSGSYSFLVADENGEIIGMGRAISDGVSDAYIQDVTVREDRRGLGIGRNLVAKLIEYLEKRKISWIGLIAEKGTSDFYTPLGFKQMAGAKPMILEKL